MDPQANCSRGLGIFVKEAVTNMRDVLNDPEKGISRIVCPTAMDALSIAPSNIYLSAAEGELTAGVGGPHRLAVALTEVRGKYDHILIDAPPSLGVLAVNALVAAEYVIIPMEAETYALMGMDLLEQTIERTRRFLSHDVVVLGVLVTKFRSGTTLHTELLEQLRSQWGNRVFDTVINMNTDIPTAAAEQLPVVVAKPQSTGANYTALAEEVLSREKQKTASTGR